MTELKLADGEEVLRQYSCMGVDNCTVFAGTVVPRGLRRKKESQGTITVTSRRVIYDMEVSGRGQPSTIHQETRIDSISSVSSVMAKFGRDIRIPVLMVLVGFILMFTPYVWAVETDAMATGGDYEVGYNAGVEVGYYDEFIQALSNGTENTIPQGYVPPVEDEFGSSDYKNGFADGRAAGEEEAVSDIANKNDFSVPTGIMIHNNVDTVILILAIIGAAVFIMGSVLFVISNRTKDWFSLRMGSGHDTGVYITSISHGSERIGVRPVIVNGNSKDMVNELGAIIVDARRSTA